MVPVLLANTSQFPSFRQTTYERFIALIHRDEKEVKHVGQCKPRVTQENALIGCGVDEVKKKIFFFLPWFLACFEKSEVLDRLASSDVD